MPSLFTFDVVSEQVWLRVDEWHAHEFYRLKHPGIITMDWMDPVDRTVIDEITWIIPMGQYPYGHKFDDQVPKAVIDSLLEAGNCLAVGALNAAAVMCRRAVEQMGKDFEIEFKNRTSLCSMLATLEERDLIDKSLSNILYKVKERGNAGAHANRENDWGIDQQQVRELFDVVVLLLSMYT